MDFVSIGLSAVLSAVLFIILEFTIILPLFKKIVTNATSKMVNEQLIPSVNDYINSKIEELTKVLTKSLFTKIRGMMGGKSKGLNSLMAKLTDPDLDLDEIDLDDYEPSTIDKISTIVQNISPILNSPYFTQRGVNNGKEENIQSKDKDGLQDESSTQKVLSSF